jgi:EmrB/QacA subfamily drug resistance transporter
MWPVNGTSLATQRWILVSVGLGSGIVFLDGTIVNVAIAAIGRELPATHIGTLEGQAYVTSGYLAVLAALLIVAGALADRYGRRRIFLLGLAGFGITSVACGLAPSMELLVVARLAQGAAGALLVPGSLAIITASFEGAARARAFGVWTAATSALLVLGPLVGGLLVDTLSWRAAFLVNVPLVAIALYGAVVHVPETRDEEAPRRVDWLGSAVVAIAVGGFAFGLIRGQEQGWSDAAAVVALAASLVAAVLFPILMVTRRDPLVPPELFRRRAFTVINIATFLVYGALYTSSFLQYVFLQNVLGYTAIAAALVALPAGIFLSLGSTHVGGLAGRLGPWPFLVVGPLIMAAGQLWLARIPADSEAWVAVPTSAASLLPPTDVLVDVLPASLLFGLGLMLVVAPLTTAIMGSVPVRNAGLGSAINNAISRVGQPLVLALLFVAISATFYGSLADSTPLIDTGSPAVRQDIQPLNPPASSVDAALVPAITQASTEAFRLAMLVTAGLLAAGAAVSAVGLSRRRPSRATSAEAVV